MFPKIRDPSRSCRLETGRPRLGDDVMGAATGAGVVIVVFVVVIVVVVAVGVLVAGAVFTLRPRRRFERA